MAGSSYPFDAGTGATITEAQWSLMTRDNLGRGVHEGGTVPGPLTTNLKVYSDLTLNTIWLQPGRATIDGFHFELAAFFGLTVATNSNTTQDRIDVVVLQLDTTANSIQPVVKQGTPAVTPVAPVVGANELLLASFSVRKNSSVVQDTEVTDQRTFIGRRYVVSESPTSLPEGSISYRPSLQTWNVTKTSGAVERLAYKSEVDALLPSVASGPTPSLQPNVTLFENTLNAVVLPGNRKLVHWYFWGKYNGVSATGSDVQIGTLPAGYIPNYNFRIVGHQFLFSNSTDDYPLIVRVATDGRFFSGGGNATWMAGGANILFDSTYIV